MNDKKNTISLSYLSQLARLQIDNPKKFLKKLENIITHIESINAIKDNKNNTIGGETQHHLLPINSINSKGKDTLLDNVKHEKINNSIVIKAQLHT